EVQEQCSLNLTHFHIVADRTSCPIWLITLLKSLYQLVHFKLTMTTSCSKYFEYDFVHALNNIETFERLSRALSNTLETFEVNFPIEEDCLRVFLDESRFKLRHIRFYHHDEKQYNHLDPFLKHHDGYLRIFIDYAKRKNSLKELGFAKRYIFSKQYIEEAQRYFNIVMLNGYEIDNPFYDVPMKNSHWSNRNTNFPRISRWMMA
ncbi:12643_t:CDS:2, partial [Funneliformis caledonium]